MELFRNRTLRRVSLGLTAAAVVALGACSDGSSPAEPIIPNETEPVEGLRAASFVADVHLQDGTISISAPKGGLNLDYIADYFGLEPGHPELSILGGDVVEVVPDLLTLTFGAPNASSLKRRVAFEVKVRNRLQGAALIGSTQLPIAPAGISSPVIFPFQNVATVTQGGVTGSNNDVIVETPSVGEVAPSDSIWGGPPHNFFNDEGCGVSDNDCFVYLPVVEEGTARDTIGGLGASDPVRLGWDVDLTVNQFRSRIIMAADLTDATPNALPTATIAPSDPAACVIGSPLALDGSGSADSDGFIASYEWDFYADGTIDATGKTATFTPPSTPASLDIDLIVTDNRGGQAQASQDFFCDYPPAEAFITAELQNTLGQPVSQVEEGGTYKYVTVSGNSSPVTPLTNYSVFVDLDETIVDVANVVLLDEFGTPVDPAFQAAYYDAVTGQFSFTAPTYPAGSPVGLQFLFTVLSGGAGNSPLDTDFQADSDEGAATPDSQVNISTPVVVPPNVLGRWLVGGAPSTSATVGQTAYLQICTTETGIEAIDAQIATSIVGAIVEVRNFESDGSPSAAAGLVHPDCFGTDDQLDDFFFPNLTSSTSANFGLSAVTPPSVGRVGIAEVIVSVNQAGTLTPTLSLPNFQVSGAQGTPNIDMQSLTVTN